MLTKTQVKNLKGFEQHFKNAKLGFCRGVSRLEIDILRPIYEFLGFKLTNPRCADCVLTMIEVIGTEYEIYKEKYDRSKKESNRNSLSRSIKTGGKNDNHQQRTNKDEVKKTDN